MGHNKERYARAFEQLAAEIRRDAIDVCRLNFESRLDSNSIADVHAITVELLYKPEV